MAEAGVAVAVVVDNKDDSGTGRVQVRYPWHSDSRATYWARVAVPMAGSGYGAYFIPEEGDELLVAFDRGDLRFPYVVGSLWNSRNQAPDTNADGRNDRRLIRTRKGHALLFDDGAKGRVRLELNDGKRLSIDDQAITLQDGNGNGVTIQSDGGTVTIRSAARLVLQAPQISIESSGLLDVKASASLVLRGAVVQIN
jgi:uncharacterized protein involved in type VI secretion and phage assembly